MGLKSVSRGEKGKETATGIKRRGTGRIHSTCKEAVLRRSTCSCVQCRGSLHNLLRRRTTWDHVWSYGHWGLKKAKESITYSIDRRYRESKLVFVEYWVVIKHETGAKKLKTCQHLLTWLHFYSMCDSCVLTRLINKPKHESSSQVSSITMIASLKALTKIL